MLTSTLTVERVYDAYRNWMLSNSQAGQFGPHWVRGVGLRFDVDENLHVGDTCNLSYDSNGHQLDGTCAFFLPLLMEGDELDDVRHAFARAISLLQDASGNNLHRVFLVAGTGYEDGEWRGEVVIENAEIAAVFE